MACYDTTTPTAVYYSACTYTMVGWSRQRGLYLLGEAARPLRRVENLEVKHGEVESEPEADGVRGGHVLMSQRRGALVGLQSLVRRVRTRVALLELREVPVVVPLHLVVEHLKAGSRGSG